MTDFDIIEYGFDAANETVNFGTRCLGANLYETSTLASLKCAEENVDPNNVYINTLAKNGKIFFNINKTLRMFGNKECSTLIFNAVFESVVDVFLPSANGRFLLICLRNGLVHVLDLFNENKSLYKRNLELNDIPEKLFVNCFIEPNTQTSISFLIVSRTGNIYRVTVEGDENTVSDENLFDLATNIKVASFSYPFLYIQSKGIYVWNVITKSYRYSDFNDVVKFLPYKGKLLALNTAGKIIHICPHTLIVPFIDNDGIDFRDITLVSENAVDVLIGVTLPNETGEIFIKMLSYPDLEEIFSIPCKFPVHVVTPETLADEVIFLSELYHENQISELRFCQIYETDPEKRLERLIRKHKFEEAEEFVKLYKLSPDLINRAKAQLIVDKPEFEPHDIDNLIDILELINDDLFKLKICWDIADESYFANEEDIRKVFSYGSKIVPKNCSEEIREYQEHLSDLLFKFDTYMAINTKYDMKIWPIFSKCDFLEELKNCIDELQFETAMILYTRLNNTAIKNIKLETIEEILSKLNNHSLTTYEPFLSTFIRVSLTYEPSSLSVFVKWLKNKIFYLEKCNRNQFPDNGIILADKIINLLRVEDNTNLFFQRQCTINKESLNELNKLLEALKGLQTLKNNFRIDLPLSDYLRGPKYVCSKLLKLEMAAEEYNNFLEEFLNNFMIQNNLEPNEILLNEIVDQMQYDEHFWVNVIESILKHITSVSVKLQATNIILEKAQVPWSDTVRKIGRNALQYSHPLVANIKVCMENEPRMIVLNRPVYKIKNKTINNLHELLWITNRIIRVNEPTMIADVFQLCKCSKERHESNVTLIMHFMRHGQYEDALKVLDNNTPEEVYVCSRRMALFIYSELNTFRKFSIRLHKHYYEMIHPILKRFLDNCPDEFEKQYFENQMNLLTNLYKLNQTFNTQYKTQQILDNNEEIRDQLLDNIITNYDSSDMDVLINLCKQVATCLSFSLGNVMFLLIEKLGNFDVILKAAEYIYEFETDTKVLCLFATMILKNLGMESTDFHEQTLKNVTMMLIDNDDVYLKGLRLMKNLAIKGFMYSAPEDILASIEVLEWANCAFHLIKPTQNNIDKALFKGHYSDNITPPGHITFVSIREVFTLYCRYIGQFKNPCNKFLTDFNDIVPMSENELLQHVGQLSTIVGDLFREGQHLTATNLITTFRTGLFSNQNPSQECCAAFNTIITKQCVPVLMHSVALAPHFDTGAFFLLLNSCPQNDAIAFIDKYIRQYKKQHNRLYEIAYAGIQFLKSKNKDFPQQMKFLSNLILTVKWWRKIDKCRIDYLTFFKVDATDRLEQLIKLNNIDEKMIEEYCKDFSLNAEMYYLKLLETILLQWECDFEVSTDVSGQQLVTFKNNEDSLLARCKNIVKVVQNRDELVNLLNELWNKVNSYQYEVLIVIQLLLLKICKQSDSSINLETLNFLKTYKRCRAPCQLEVEQWFTKFPDTLAISPLSEFRLPFTPSLFTSDIWSIIRPEVNLNTYKFWFTAINILKKNLNKVDICCYAIKEIVTSGTLGKFNEKEWNLYPKHEELFVKISECIEHISDLEKATSAIYHLMINTPRGADQVAAAELCFNYAAKYFDANPNNKEVEKAYIKVKRKFYNFSALNILHKFHLNEDKYINLVTQPEELIEELYKDSRIVKKADAVDLHCPDINEATNALAELFQLQIYNIRCRLLAEWLSDTSVDFDSTLNMPNNSKTSIRSLGSNDNQKRAIYLCTGDVTVWQVYLYNIGLGEASETVSLSYKAKALICFCAISDLKTITELTEGGYNELINYIDKLTLLSDLEHFGMTMDILELDKTDKKELLKRLGRQHLNPLCLHLMASLCITYTIDNLKYWKFIIANAIKLNMFSELKSYVEYLKYKHCPDNTFYIHAWQVIINNAFNTTPELSEEELREVYIENFLMFQRCPVLFSINFENIVSKCIKMRMFDFAAVLLQYLSGTKREEFGTTIIDSSRSVFKDLDVLNSHGIWGISKVKSILST